MFNPDDPHQWSQEQTTRWRTWWAKAQAATSEAEIDYTSEKKVTLKSQIWSELKVWLLKYVFAGKCAYCEAKISGSFFGEGEHYRPKGKVTICRDGKRVSVERQAGTTHAGYFWLAYHWLNLLPACQECNNRKRDQFPAAVHVFDPAPTCEELDAQEGPLLLHPYRDDPSLHIRFGKFGIVAPVDGSDKGRITIDVLGLDREELTERRRERQEIAYSNLGLAVLDLINNGTPLEVSAYLSRFTSPDAEFSAAVSDFLLVARQEMANRIAAGRSVGGD